MRKLLILLFSSMAFGQGAQLPKYTVANLPAASSQPSYVVQVLDGSTATDCTSGGGTYNVLCTPHGGSWTSVASTAISLTTTGTSGAATLTGAVLNIPQYQGALSLTTTGSSGPATLISNTLNIPQYSGGGGSGVQYNPTTTSYIVASFSGLYDDSDSNSRALPTISNFSCTGTAPSVCTVNFASAHGLSVGGAIDMHSTTSWPYSQQAAQFGSFQIATATTTQVTFSTPTSLSATCSSSCGTAYDATYWGIWQFAIQPYIYGHGTVFGIETATDSLATNFTSLTSGLTGTPTYLIDQTGQDDLAAGRTVTQVENDHLTVWAAAHTAGMVVVQTTLMPAAYGITGQGIKPGQINYWMWQQATGVTSTTKANGQFINRYADPATPALTVLSTPKIPNPGMNLVFAQTVNNLFGVQSGLPIQPPLTFSLSESSLSSDIPGHFNYTPEQFVDQNGFGWMLWANNGNNAGIDLYSNASSNPSMLRAWNQNLTAGQSANLMSVGFDTNNYDQCFTSFTYVGASNTGNSVYMICAGMASPLWRAFANGGFQVPGVHASSGTQPVFADTSGNFSVGTASSGLNGTVTYTSSQTASTSDNGKLVIMNCSSACAYTLPATQPSTIWAAGVTSQGSTVATIALGGSDTWNGASSVPVLNSYRILWVFANTATSTDYRGDAPLAASTNVTLTPSTNALSISASATGATAFSALTSSTNTTAAMVVGTGASLGTSGTGTISANELNSVPFCTGFAPTNGQNLQYTTASSPNPCYTAAAGGSGGTAAPPYLEISSTFYLPGDQMSTVTKPPSSPTWLNSVAPGTITNGANGDIIYTTAGTGTAYWQEQSGSSSVESVFQCITSQAVNTSRFPACGIWIWDSTNSKVYQIQTSNSSPSATTNGALYTVYSCTYSGSSVPSSCSSQAQIDNGFNGWASQWVHLKITKSGSNLLFQVSLNGGQNFFTLYTATGIGTISDGGTYTFDGNTSPLMMDVASEAVN